MNPEYKITVIIPVYNEEESLWKLEAEMTKFLNVSPLPSCVLFVNDGSTDNSLPLIRNICNEDKRYSYISLKANSGLSTALKAGIDQVQTPYTGYIDADLQTSPTDFLMYFKYLDTHTMINGIRANRSDTWLKRMSSASANTFRRLMIKDGITDTCCPLKLMHTAHARQMPFFKGMHRFIPALMQLQGGSVKQVIVSHYPRYAGTAKYHLFNRLVGPFFDTLAFVWMRKRYINYEVTEACHTSTEKQKEAI